MQFNSGEGHGNPLQYSCLENPVDRGAWWAAVHGVAQSWKQLKQLRMQACIAGSWFGVSWVLGGCQRLAVQLGLGEPMADGWRPQRVGLSTDCYM